MKLNSFNHPMAVLIKTVFSRAIIFYATVVWLSNFVLDYPKLKFKVQINNLNVVMPDSFLPMAQLERRQKISLKDFAKCFSFYNELAHEFPDQADGQGMMGFCYFHLGKMDEAISYYEKAAKINPKIFWFHYNLGVIYFQTGRYSEAVKALQDAVQCSTGETLNFISQSRVVYMSIIRDDHFTQRNVLINIQKGYQDAYQLLILSYFNLKDYQGMLRAATGAIANSPRDFFYFYAGVASYELLQYDNAVFFLNKAIQLNPSFSEAVYYYGQNLQALGKKEDAQKALEQAAVLLQSRPSSLPRAEEISLKLF